MTFEAFLQISCLAMKERKRERDTSFIFHNFRTRNKSHRKKKKNIRKTVDLLTHMRPTKCKRTFYKKNSKSKVKSDKKERDSNIKKVEEIH